MPAGSAKSSGFWRRRQNRVAADKVSGTRGGAPSAADIPSVVRRKKLARITAWAGKKENADGKKRGAGSAATRLLKGTRYQRIAARAQKLKKQVQKLPFLTSRNGPSEQEHKDSEYIVAKANWAGERTRHQILDIAALSRRVAKVHTLLSSQQVQTFLEALRADAKQRLEEERAREELIRLNKYYSEQLSRSLVAHVCETIFGPDGIRRLIRLRNEILARKARQDRAFTHWQALLLKGKERSQLRHYLNGLWYTKAVWANFDGVAKRRTDASLAIVNSLKALCTRRVLALMSLNYQQRYFSRHKLIVFNKWHKRLYRAVLDAHARKTESLRQTWAQRRARIRSKQALSDRTQCVKTRSMEGVKSGRRSISCGEEKVIVGIAKRSNHGLRKSIPNYWRLVSQPLPQKIVLFSPNVLAEDDPVRNPVINQLRSDHSHTKVSTEPEWQRIERVL